MKAKSMLTKSLWCLLFLLLITACPAAAAKIIYVDDDGPADFNTIQAAIDDANDGDTVLVAPGTYTGDGNRDINFKGKAITVKSEDDPETCIIDCQGFQKEPHRAFYFHSEEDANSIIQGFTITGGFIVRHEPGGGILCENSSPKIVNCIIVGNEARKGGGIATTNSAAQIIDCIVKNNIAADGGGIEIGTNDNGAVLIKGCIIAGNHAVFYPKFGGIGGGIIVRSFSHIINCTITGNLGGGAGGGIYFTYGANMSNSIICGNTFQLGYGSEVAINYRHNSWQTTRMVYIENSLVGTGIENDFGFTTGNEDYIRGQWLQEDPCFVALGHLDPSGTQDYPYNYFWVDGDYHLKSQAGRWDSNSGSWIVDYVTSPCIDAGDPNVPIGDEPEPNGGIINMGAYGGTPEASKSYILSKIIYVDDDAVGLNNGSSWQNAYTFLQDALADAETSEKAIEIRVAQGVYKPNQGARNRIIIFQLINGVTLSGGYAGLTEPDPDIRDIEKYETILSGDLNGDDIDVSNPSDLPDEPTRSENSELIVTGSYTNRTAVLDGFIITGGQTRRHRAAIDAPTGIGGGMENYSGSPTINNCTFIGNSAEVSGGGMLNDDDSNPILTNCKFIENYGGRGGGVYNSNSHPTFINCTFKNNCADNGAGMGIRGGSVMIKSCIFNENQAFAGGGIESSESMLCLENCVFTQNVVHGCRSHIGGLGGALCCGDPLAGSRITECSFSNNIAVGGAGIFIGTYDGIPFGRGEEVLVTGCTFKHNRASFGAAIDNYTNSVMIENSSFIDNSAITSGGAVSNTFGTISFSNCLFTGNSANQQASVISAYGSCWPDGTLDHFFALEFINCTLVENIAPLGRMVACRSEGSAELDSVQISNCIINNGGNEIYNPDGSQIMIEYTDFLGGASSIDDPCNTVVWGMGNIDENPLFVDPGYWDPNGTPDDPNNDFWIEGDYHLKSQAGRWDSNSGSWIVDYVTSPCIDAGDPNMPVGDEPEPNGGIINMGAYGGTPQASKSL